MKKLLKKAIDLTQYGPIDDISDGYQDCIDSFCIVLEKLFERKPLLSKRQKVKVYYSNLNYRTKIPTRYLVAKVVTFGNLCRRYEKEFGKPFNTEEQKEKNNRDLENLRKQGEKEMAWSFYHRYLDLSKAAENEKRIQSLPEDEQQAAREKLQKSEGVVMRIG